ncbi:MAG: uracil-DNA glycosylase [Aquificaceae bacterium]|nr:uracil-DNA glycosylase [Aquificaceae bacterium]MCX7989872.1 uracil-DNA glycosylase [Aquificaceae bacterium]MDW8032138.1 uracil-DNA glycosylase [Aquificaceae bacterium]MDW8293959.1 uracil-DNA glycosylase [Aquificaceae bacterium]
MRKVQATLTALSEIGFHVLYVTGEGFREQKTHVRVQKEEKDRKKMLEDIFTEMERDRSCVLYEGASGYVFGEGNPYSPVVFVGEAPGEEEDQQKRPFVGRAGRYLNQKLEEAGLKREDIYITNVVKSRPPGNRKPTPKEMQSCLPYLKREIEVIKPKLIVCLGSTALEGVLGRSLPVSKHRGRLFEYPFNRDIKVLLTYHPAYILRNPGAEGEFLEDLKRVRSLLSGL